MTKSAHDDVLDASHTKTATCTRVTVCSAAPANFADIANVDLAEATLSAGIGGGDWSVANGDVSGRKVTCGAQSALPITSSGTATHLAYDDGVTMLRLTECTPQALTSGGTVSIPAVDFELEDPV